MQPVRQGVVAGPGRVAVRGLLVAGTTSDAGKSVVTAGICRWLAREGVKVAPFKAQNMSLNSAVVRAGDGGWAEIGRAQAMQAAACGIAPDIRFNPVLLKPGSDLSSQVVLLGEAIRARSHALSAGLHQAMSTASVFWRRSSSGLQPKASATVT